MALFRNFFHKSGYNVKMSYFCNIKSLVNFGKDHNQAKYCVISFYHLISKFGLYVRSKPWFIFEDGVYWLFFILPAVLVFEGSFYLRKYGM